MPALLIVLPILALLLAGALILGMRLLRRGFGFSWLAAVGGALAAWGLVLFSAGSLPLSLPLANWQPRVLLPISPTLLLDRTNWPFAVSLATLCLAVILTNVVRPTGGSRPGGSWGDLAGSLGLTAAALLATLAGNLLALLLAWALLDLVETVLWLSKVRSGRESESVVVSLAIRLVGVGVATWAGLSTYRVGQTLAFNLISPQMSLYLLIAAGIRLGVWPLHPPLPQVRGASAGLRTLLRLAPAVSSLALAARAAATPLPAVQTNLLLGFAGLAACFGGVMWLNLLSVQESLPYWISGMGGLALAAGLRGQPGAALAWGLALVLVGAIFGLGTVRPRGLRLLLLLTGLGLSGLPYTPAWPGVRLYAQPLYALLPVFLLGQSLLLLGTLKQAVRLIPAPVQAERWVLIIYPLGLGLLFGAGLLISWWPAPGVFGPAAVRPTWLESAIGAAAALLAGAGFVVWRRRQARRRPRTPQPLPRLRRLMELNWLYLPAWQTYRWMMRSAAFVSAVLEGQAGVLWALLFLVLLLSLFVQLGLGGA